MNWDVNKLPGVKCLVILLVVTLYSCGEERKQEYIASINPTYTAEVVRYDETIRAIDIENIDTDISTLVERYPAFSDIYFNNVIAAAPDADPAAVLGELLRDTGYIKLMTDVHAIYPDLASEIPSLSQALENYARVFAISEDRLPSLYTFISGFVYQTFVFEDEGRDGVGIGLDMFLGDQFPYHTIDPKNPAFSEYITRTFNPDHMAKKVIEVLVEDQMSPPMGADFLSLITWSGKKMYIMDQILDFVSDTIITEYTADQLAWCRNNEAEIWQFFFDKNLFYSTNLSDFNKLISPGPTSPGMPPESPSRTGNYMGWQMINAYMARHPNKSVIDLITLDDAQAILDASRYRPG